MTDSSAFPDGPRTEPAELALRLVGGHGTTFAEEAGITLADEPGPLWQLLVLTQLLSARISSGIAVASARELFARGWRTPGALRASTWRQRVDALGRGGYRRYDFSTETRLDENARLLLEAWGGDLRRLHAEASDAASVMRRLRGFSGIGPTGAAIFVREVQGTWPDLAPFADALVLDGARAAGLPGEAHSLARLVPTADLPRLCAALVRVARRPSLLESL